MSSRANYGIDSPAIVVGFFLISLVSFGVTTVVAYFGGKRPFVLAVLIGAGVYFFLSGWGMLWYSKVGKLRIRDQILETIHWRGDEIVLDVGCGRGLLLISA